MGWRPGEGMWKELKWKGSKYYHISLSTCIKVWKNREKFKNKFIVPRCPPSNVIFISLEISQCPISTVGSDHDRDDRESQHTSRTPLATSVLLSYVTLSNKIDTCSNFPVESQVFTDTLFTTPCLFTFRKDTGHHALWESLLRGRKKFIITTNFCPFHWWAAYFTLFSLSGICMDMVSYT